MGLLGFERGVSTLAQQVGFARELDHLLDVARANGRADDPVVRATPRRRVDRAQTHAVERAAQHGGTRRARPRGVDLQAVLGLVAPRPRQPRRWTSAAPTASIGEGFPYELTLDQKLFLFSRADTIYGGSNEIQRNVFGERVLGLPREPR